MPLSCFFRWRSSALVLPISTPCKYAPISDFLTLANAGSHDGGPFLKQLLELPPLFYPPLLLPPLLPLLFLAIHTAMQASHHGIAVVTMTTRHDNLSGELATSRTEIQNNWVGRWIASVSCRHYNP